MNYKAYTGGTYNYEKNEGEFHYRITDEKGLLIVGGKHAIQNENTNRAHLKAIITAIHNLPDDARVVDVYSPSEYAIKTINGSWGRRKNADLFAIWRTVRNRHLGVIIKWNIENNNN